MVGAGAVDLLGVGGPGKSRSGISGGAAAGVGGLFVGVGAGGVGAIGWEVGSSENGKGKIEIGRRRERRCVVRTPSGYFRLSEFQTSQQKRDGSREMRRERWTIRVVSVPSPYGLG